MLNSNYLLFLEFPNDAYTLLSQNLICCSLISQEKQEADWLILDNNEKAAMYIKIPLLCGLFL